jgi:hypothetical protein
VSDFDRSWRDLQLETLVELSLGIGGVQPEEELVEELLQRAVGTLDARVGLVATRFPGGQEAVVRAVSLAPSLDTVRRLLGADFPYGLRPGETLRAPNAGDPPPHELLAAPWSGRTSCWASWCWVTGRGRKNGVQRR